MAQCLFQVWDQEKHILSICGECAEWKKGKITLCDAHARYVTACGVKGIKLIREKEIVRGGAVA